VPERSSQLNVEVEQNVEDSQDQKIPYPKIDIAKINDPIQAITSDSQFRKLAAFFDQDPASSTSLTSANGRSIIFTILRNLRPEHVVEIGTYKGGTTRTMCRAIHANKSGTVHTVGPFDTEHFLPSFENWPSYLRSKVQ